ncbi:hypothetical protein CR513_35735, partial [Mucuna pruriens]
MHWNLNLSPYSSTLHSLALASQTHGGAWCFRGVSLDRGGTSQELGSRRLSEGTDWDLRWPNRLLFGPIGSTVQQPIRSSPIVPSTEVTQLSCHVTPGEALQHKLRKGRVGNALYNSVRSSLACVFSKFQLVISSDALYDLDPEIEITLRRLRKARNIVVSNSSNSISSSDNSNLVTNTFDSVEYSSTNNFAESKQMENNDRTLKELAIPDVTYLYPQLEPAQTYKLKSSHTFVAKISWSRGRRSPQAFEGIPCGLFHNEAAGDTERLHQDEGVPILLGGSSKRLAVSIASSLQHLGRHEVYVLGEVLFGIQNRNHQEGNMWDQATFWRNSTRILGKIQQAVCHMSTSSD